MQSKDMEYRFDSLDEIPSPADIFQELVDKCERLTRENRLLKFENACLKRKDLRSIVKVPLQRIGILKFIDNQLFLQGDKEDDNTSHPQITAD